MKTMKQLPEIPNDHPDCYCDVGYMGGDETWKVFLVPRQLEPYSVWKDCPVHAEYVREVSKRLPALYEDDSAASE